MAAEEPSQPLFDAARGNCCVIMLGTNTVGRSGSKERF